MSLFIILIITVLRMATFLIQLDNTHYTAGDTVSGQVVMTVPASISGCKAVCLRLSAFECLKWVNPRQIPQPASTTIRNDPSKVHPPTQPLHHVDKIQVSECESEQKSDSGLRPRVVRTANNDFFDVEFNEKRRQFGFGTVKLYESSKLPAGQYSFPFSFKSLQNWPGSLNYSSDKRKAQIKYNLTAWVDPVTPHFDFQTSRQVIISERVHWEKKSFSCQVTSFLCIEKGTTSYELSWGEGSYSLKSTATLNISIDNSQCSVDVKAISLSIVHSMLVEEGKATQETVFLKQITGVRAGEKKTDEKAIVENIDLSQVKGLLSSSHGHFVRSEARIEVTLVYDALFYSCPPASIPLKLHSPQSKQQQPLVFHKDLKQIKAAPCVLILENSLKQTQFGEKL